MMRTTPHLLLSIAMLPLCMLATLALHTPEASACGNSMQRVIKVLPTSMMAMEYLEEHAYAQAAATAFDAHSKLKATPTLYKTSQSTSLVRSAHIAAIALVRIHGVDEQGELKHIKSLPTPSERFIWAQDVLEWHHARDPQDLTTAIYLAEARARSIDAYDLKQALVTLSDAAEQDLMPDAHAWATLSALQRLAGLDDAQSISSCEAIGSFDACSSLSLVMAETPEYATHSVKNKRRKVAKSRGARRAKHVPPRHQKKLGSSPVTF